MLLDIFYLAASRSISQHLAAKLSPNHSGLIMVREISS
jgi:hypothetical protein